MGDASCMRRSAEVSIERNASVVIVSATSGTTNALIDIGRTAESGRWTESEQKIQSLIEKHQKIARELELSEQSEKTKQLQIIFQEIETLAKGICYLRDASPKAMDALMKGRTSFIIAHRLSTIKNADLILVMSGGDIIEQGNHERLLAAGGVYAGMYNSQFERKVVPHGI